MLLSMLTPAPLPRAGDGCRSADGNALRPGFQSHGNDQGTVGNSCLMDRWARACGVISIIVSPFFRGLSPLNFVVRVLLVLAVSLF